MIADPWFYAVAVPAILLMGISKGGFASGAGMFATPLLALAVPIPQAAAILLPILIVMDAAGLWAYRGSYSRENLRLILVGGPPLSIYLLPQRLEKSELVGTTVVFFAAVNLVKVIPYTWLGLFDARNLATSAVLIPLAPVGIWIGVRIMRRLPEALFYRICYALLLVVGAKLLWDGVAGL